MNNTKEGYKMNKKYDYITIERINCDWFIMRFKKVVHVSTKYQHKNSKYILIGKNELETILVNGLDHFLDNTMITIFKSKKSLVEKFKSEPFYKHLFN